MSRLPTASNSPLLDTLPAPQVVRQQVGRLLRELDLLRRLLRLAESAAQERERREKGGGCGG
jgi:hypothetical protein